jgi:CRP-like cAMP-binding protein
MHDADRSETYLPLLRELDALRDLPDEPARYLAGGSLLRTLTRGQVLCEKGSPGAGFFCLLSGRVKLSAVAADGSERVLELVLPGRVFGQAAAVLDQPFPFLAQALVETQVLQVSRERIRKAIGQWPEMAGAMLRSVSLDCMRLVHDLEACCLMSARQRLVDFLLKEARPVPASQDGAELSLPASKAVVASSLNLTPETFSRELHDLARRGLVRVERRTLEIPSLGRLRDATRQHLVGV